MKKGLSVHTSLNRRFDYVELREGGPRIGGKPIRIIENSRVFSFGLERDLDTILESQPVEEIIRTAIEYCLHDNKGIITRRANGFYILDFEQATLRKVLVPQRDFVMEKDEYFLRLQFCEYKFR